MASWCKPEPLAPARPLMDTNPMRILVTNDDGIHAPGLLLMDELAGQLAGEDGEVWTVAPMVEQSGVGHCVSYINPFRLEQLAERRFGVHGTPADCVLAGLYRIMDDPPDLVLSGVNRGNNSGENTLYSGTVGAAMEAALQDFRSIAVSQYFGPANCELDDPFDATRVHGLKFLRDLVSCTPWDKSKYSLFLNVNFPPCSANDVRGMRVGNQGFRHDTTFRTKSFVTPAGREYLVVVGDHQHNRAADGSDIELNLANFVSVTPMRADLTDYGALREMADLLHAE